MGSGDVAPVLVTLTITVAVTLLLILRGQVGRALARRIDGTSGQPDSAALTEMQGRIAELEERVERVQEQEERLDFAERLLAQQREQPRLGS